MIKTERAFMNDHYGEYPEITWDGEMTVNNKKVWVKARREYKEVLLTPESYWHPADYDVSYGDVVIEQADAFDPDKDDPSGDYDMAPSVLTEEEIEEIIGYLEKEMVA